MTRSSQTREDSDAKTSRTALLGAGFGTFVEYYDFVIYGFMAAVISQQFFPTGDPVSSLMLTFGSFLASYLVRPLGAVIFAPLSDKFGRRPILALVILVMTVATAAIGLLPTYAQVGVASPVLLTALRLVQGLSAGGEYGSASSMVAEFAPAGKRGFYLSFMTLSVGAGLLGGSLIATLASTLTPPEAFNSWAWRIPFLLALPIGLIGLYVRFKLEETPYFKKLAETGEVKRTPLLTALRRDGKNVVLGIGLAGVQTLTMIIYTVYSSSYLKVVHGYSGADAQLIVLSGLTLFCIVTVPLGKLTDAMGRRSLLIATSIGLALWMVPSFLLFASHSVLLSLLAVLVAIPLMSLNMTAAIAILTEMFATDTRTTGASIGWQTANTIFGGPSPLIMTSLAATGILLLPALYAVAVIIVCLVFVLLAKDSFRAPLRVSVSDSVIEAEGGAHEPARSIPGQ